MSDNDSTTRRSSHGSGTSFRLDSVAENISSIAARLEGMDLRSRESELRTRESLMELRGSIGHLRDLLDVAARDHASLRVDVVKHDDRLDHLEKQLARHDVSIERIEPKLPSVTTTAGAGAAGGGIIAVIAELFQRLAGS